MECLLSRTHIIAATFWGNTILVGEGDRVYAYCLESLSQVGFQTAFTTTNVHGIRVVGKPTGTCAVFGSRFLTVMTAEVAPTSVVTFKVVLQPVMFDDWIWDVAWLQSGTSVASALALCFGHNRVTHWDWQTRQALAVTTCTDYCLVYAAQLVGTSWKQLVAVVGTVYREVLLWVPSQPSPAPVLHRLTGHQGPIFSVSLHVPQRLLCSTSDDRSLRIYRFHDGSSSSGTSVGGLGSGGHSQQPFGPTQLAAGWFSSMHALYGHDSRVWRAAILHTCYLSVGEDGYVCFWNCSGNLMNRMSSPGGGSVWCLAVNEDETFAVTGSSGSALSLWNVNEVGNQSAKTTWIEAFKDGADFPRNLAILSTSGTLSLVVSTNEGRLLRWSLAASGGGRREEIFLRDYLASYSVLAVSPSRNFVALGGMRGHVAVIRCGPGQSVSLASEWQVHDGRVHSIRWVSEDPPAYLSSGPNGIMVMSRVGEQEAAEEQETMDLYATCVLPRGRQRWATTALFCPATETLYVGDRCGSVHGFYVDVEEDMVEPFRSYTAIHGNNGVTDIQQQHETLVTAGRDGRVLLYSLRERGLHYLRVFWCSPTLEWIGHMILQSNGLLLCGYHMSDFVLWSTWQQRAVFQLNCGGGHRSWDFAMSGHDGLFACLKTGRIMVHRCSLKEMLQRSCIRAPLHRKKITADCLLFTEENASGVCQSYVVTAGEDSIITISQLYQERTHLVQRVACRLYGHVSIVQALACCRPTHLAAREERLLVSAGGRAQLCLWRVTASRQCSMTSEQLHDHRLWSLDRQHRGTFRFPTADPLARYVDAHVWEAGPADFRIVTAASDALIRVFRYQWGGAMDMQLIIPAGQQCPFRVLRAPLPLSTGHQTVAQRPVQALPSLLLSCGNDGLLRFWKLEAERHDLIAVFRRHQSAINALDVLSLQDALGTEAEKRRCLAEVLDEPENDSSKSDWSSASSSSSSNSSDNDEVYAAAFHHLFSMLEQRLKVEAYVRKTVFSYSDEEQQRLIEGWVRQLDRMVLVVTGGDDNALVLTNYLVTEDNSVVVLEEQILTSAQCTQITGTRFLLPRGNWLVSAGVDQRLRLWQRVAGSLQEHCSRLSCIPDIAAFTCWRKNNDDVIMVAAGEGLDVTMYASKAEEAMISQTGYYLA